MTLQINSWCLKLHTRLTRKKTKSMVVSWSRTSVPRYGNLILGGAELEEIKGLRILGVNLESKWTYETHLRESLSKEARSLRVVRRAGKLFDSPRVPKNCFNAYVLPNLEYFVPCGCRLIWICWLVLFAVRRGCEKASFVVWSTKGRSVPCVYCIRFIT